MKTFTLLIALLPLVAFAGNYSCDLKVYENKCNSLSGHCENPLVGEIKFQQDHIGAIAGSVYSLPVSTKKNIFGKVTQEVTLSLEGVMQYSGNADENTLVELYLTLDVTTYKRGINKQRLDLAQIKGQGTQSAISVSDAYTTIGGCSLNL